jgi:hypothetical protein
MGERDDMDLILLDDEDDRVRETGDWCSTSALVEPVFRVRERGSVHTLEGLSDGIEELISESLALVLVPVGCSEQILARVELDDHPERRRRSARCAISSFFTCDQGTPFDAPLTTASTRRRISADHASS